MYTYPEALNAMQKVATDLFDMAKSVGKFDPKKRVSVRVTADANTGTASVDWDDMGTYLSVTIFMPVLPATHRMTAKEFEGWAAYLYHEVGHPLWTCKKTWRAAVNSNRHRLLNSLEDVREENLSIRAKIAVNGKQVLTDLVESLMVKAWNGGYDPNNPKSIGWTLSYMGRAVCNGYQLDTHSLMAALDPNGPVAKVLTWAIPELGACKSTQDCLDLADRIVAALPKNPPKKDKPNEQGEQGEQGEGEQGEQGEGEQGEQASDKPTGEQGEGQEGQEGEKTESPPTGKGKGGNARGGPVDESEQPLTHEDIEETSLAPQPKEAFKPEKPSPYDYSYDAKAIREAQVIEAIRDAMRDKRKPPQVYKGGDYDTATLKADAAKATRQRALLARALKANDMDDYDSGRMRGRLDSRALARKAAGSTAIFGKRVVTEGYETDVAVLVDGSGSMAGTEIRVATQLALVIAQAASQVGVGCEVFMFGRGGHLVEITKGKKQPDVRAFAGTVLHVGGGTPLCPSMLKIASKQAARAVGKRKLLFAITDGGCNMGFTSMVSTVAYIEKAYGIEVCNLMIGSPVSKAFTNEVSVSSTANVCEVGLEQLTRQLERARA